jgi:hypothetical protein
MQPYNYTIQAQDPFQSYYKGYELGQAENLQREQMAMQREQAAMKSQALRQKMMQDQAAAERAQSQAMAAQGLMDKIRAGTANATDIQSFAITAPKDQSEAALKVWEGMNKEQQQGTLGFTAQVLSAFGSKKPEIGIQLLNDRALAERNSGREDQAKAYETWAKIAESDPVTAQVMIAPLVGQLPGGDKVIEAWTKAQGESRARELQPFEVRGKAAQTKSSEIAAKYAESSALQDLEKKGWDIRKIQSDMDISKQNARIAAAGVAASREGNALRREELGLKVQEMRDKRESTIREKVAGVESARFNIDNMLNTADRVLKTPKNIIGSAAGPISSRMVTLSQDTADFEELVGMLGSQAFLSQVPNLVSMGALSNAEGEKLQSSLQSFSLRQSPERLIENVKESQRLMLKSRSNIAKKFGAPESVPDTPAAAPTATDIDALLKKYGGK